MTASYNKKKNKSRNHLQEKLFKGFYATPTLETQTTWLKHVMINFLVDESPTQRRGIAQHEEKLKTGSSGVGPGQATTTKDNMEVKISSTASTSNGNEEHGTTIEEKESKNTTLDASTAMLSSGDKAKRLVTSPLLAENA